MARKKSKEKEKESASIGITNLILNAITGKEDETTSEAAKSFLDFWQRKKGESVVSAQNILKAAGVIGSYAVYRHVDPVPDSKVDNLAVFGGAAILLALLFVPRSAELGGRFPQFESGILREIGEGLTLEEKREILKWIQGLSNWQEKRVINLLRVVDEKGNISFDITPLKEAEIRQMLLELIGDEPSIREDIDKTVTEVKKFFSENWPTREQVAKFDEDESKDIRKITDWLAEHGIKSDRRIKEENCKPPKGNFRQYMKNLFSNLKGGVK